MDKLAKVVARVVEKNQSHAQICHFVTNGLNGIHGQIAVRHVSPLMAKMANEFDPVVAIV